MNDGLRRVLYGTLAAASGLLSGACQPSAQPPAGGDFAVLARAESGYRQARPGQALAFPADHGAHPAFRIEWWYLTATLRDDDGRTYGVQWTLFRTATRPPDRADPANPWQDPQVYMAHFAITTPQGHRAFQRYARGGVHGRPDHQGASGGRTARGLARAGVRTAPFAAWLDDWSLHGSAASWLPLDLRARQDDVAARLHLTATAGLVLQGVAGFSQKHRDGGGSYYYSQPFLKADGALLIDGRTIPVSGDAWLDHEWSSQFLQPDQAGWDWFALHLDSGEKLMLFRVRATARERPDYRYGVLIAADGRYRPLSPDRIDFEVLDTRRVAGRDLPLHWRIHLPEIGRTLEIEALHANQWMDVDFGYWEGVVLAHGDGPGSTGRGYLELTGYPAR